MLRQSASDEMARYQPRSVSIYSPCSQKALAREKSAELGVSVGGGSQTMHQSTSLCDSSARLDWEVSMNPLKLAVIAGATLSFSPLQAQAWRDCVPNSIAPGGCDSIGPGGGRSIGPGGGQSIGPGGGRSIGPGGGQSIGPRGGRSIGPGGGQSLTRDRSRGLNPDTLRPYQNPYRSSPYRSRSSEDDPDEGA